MCSMTSLFEGKIRECGFKGAAIVLRVLQEELLNTGSITIEDTRPSTPILFIQIVLVSGCILCLIQEDRGGITYAEAKTILHESDDFGKNYYMEEDDSNTDESA
ncbi:hypothetical protein BDA99DRAFT_542680 [Phascolomyces articulosus]|uniref:Restriction of telomere capping protein 4 C-terminal domain-containing protein n=1 Tax=Phascolomyces articulosus TaxID=60185 RepID=A0AAD5JZR5_9FUNG|nr:hypothetical protein BDA99DRAFT_542680 [Phascolomyces articulosus]